MSIYIFSKNPFTMTKNLPVYINPLSSGFCLQGEGVQSGVLGSLLRKHSTWVNILVSDHDLPCPMIITEYPVIINSTLSYLVSSNIITTKKYYSQMILMKDNTYTEFVQRKAAD